MFGKASHSRRRALGRAIRRLVAAEQGAALVEFTIFAPMFVVASIYTMDFGLIFYYKLELQNVAQAGAQWAMANSTYNSSYIQIAAQNATRLPANAFTVTSSQFCGCSENASGDPLVTQLSVGACTGGSTCTHGVPGTYVSVSATPTTPYHSLIPYGLVPSTYSLAAQSLARVQ